MGGAGAGGIGEVLVWATGLAGVLVAAVLAWRWRGLPLVASGAEPGSALDGARNGLRVMAASLWSGVIAGLLVPGLGGRLLMRITAATSAPSVQGRLTEAGERIGEITLGGTVGFLLFVGLLGGLTAAVVYPFVRRWLPRSAGWAGLVVAGPLLGIVGVADPLSPRNIDFLLLTPRWLAVLLIVLVAVLFAVTFTSLAARLDAGLPPLDRRPSSILAHASLVTAIGPPVAIATAAYVGGCALLAGRTSELVRLRQRLRRVATAVVAVVVVASGARTIDAIAEILSG